MRRFALVALLIGASLRAQTPANGASISGSVVDEAGHPVVGADIAAFPETAHARSDSAGHFLLHDLGGGFYHVRVRRLGYGSVEVTTDLTKNGHVDLKFELKPRPAMLDSIVVLADGKCSPLSYTGFNCRRRFGGKGVYLTDDDLFDKGAVEIGDIFSGVPGFRIDTVPTVWGAKPRPLATHGNRCLNALVNGKPSGLTNPIPRYADQLIAVEIYSQAGDVPDEYQRYVWLKSIRQTASPVGYDSPSARCSLVVYWSAFT